MVGELPVTRNGVESCSGCHFEQTSVTALDVFVGLVHQSVDAFDDVFAMLALRVLQEELAFAL